MIGSLLFAALALAAPVQPNGIVLWAQLDGSPAPLTATVMTSASGAVGPTVLFMSPIGPSKSWICGTLFVPADKGATLVMPSGTVECRAYVALDISSTVLIQCSNVSMAIAATDGGVSFGRMSYGSGAGLYAIDRDFHIDGINIGSQGATEFLWTPGGSIHFHYIYRQVGK